MATTRREFIEGVAVAGAVAAVAGSGARRVAQAVAAPLACPKDELGELGSPYFLSSEAPDDLGGDEAYSRLRERIIHFGMPAAERDRYLLGL